MNWLCTVISETILQIFSQDDRGEKLAKSTRSKPYLGYTLETSTLGSHGPIQLLRLVHSASKPTDFPVLQQLL